jgi:hypothetical protein
MSAWQGYSFDKSSRYVGILCCLGFVIFIWIVWFVAVPSGNAGDIWIQWIGTALFALLGAASLWIAYGRTVLTGQSLSSAFAGWSRTVSMDNIVEADFIAVPYTLGTVMLAVRTKQGRKIRFYAPAVIGVQWFGSIKNRFPPQSRFLVL